MNVKLRYKIVAVLVLLFGLKSCFDNRERTISLKPNEPVLIDSGVGHGNIVIKKKNGDVVIKPRTFGWSFDPGLAGGSNGLNIAVEVLYWYRMNLLAGVQVYPLKPNAFVGLGYRLAYKRLSNLTPYVGVTARGEPCLGIFLRFGSS